MSDLPLLVNHDPTKITSLAVFKLVGDGWRAELATQSERSRNDIVLMYFSGHTNSINCADVTATADGYTLAQFERGIRTVLRAGPDIVVHRKASPLSNLQAALTAMGVL